MPRAQTQGRVITVAYTTHCRACGGVIERGEQAVWLPGVDGAATGTRARRCQHVDARHCRTADRVATDV